ncbi:MAG: DpnII family type II restriction endonuclease [Bacteroidota bacterium]|nr:DpnII family type II restriction endonuclease [Bacteroidota bacterium]
MANKNIVKFKTVIDKNTFYFYNPVFQEKYESYINSLNETLLVLKNQVETQGLKKEIFENLLNEKENGLRALLALTGFANESLKRLITVLRVADNKELSKVLYKDRWTAEIDGKDISEWGDVKITKLIRDNSYFRKGIVNLFFEGSTIPFLAQTLPLFELKKLSISKLKFEVPAMIDTLVRYKEKGSYSGKAENNPEVLIASLIEESNLTFQKGDLTELFKRERVAKRTMDFIIPDKNNPKVIIESSFLVTTSSGQGDKSKTEGSIKKLISKYYPKAKFIGFVDGIGWYVRKGDLMRMVSAYDDVFTFHKDEIERFKQFLKKECKR